MAAIYYTPDDAIEAALAEAIAGYPWLKIEQLDRERVIIRESMIVCAHGLGTRFTAIYRDITGRYIGSADCYHAQQKDC